MSSFDCNRSSCIGVDDDDINAHFAGRIPVGNTHPITLSKNKQFHVRKCSDGTVKEILACGLACSEIFSGRNLAAVLRPGFEYERHVLEQLESEEMTAVIPPLAVHTSAGVPAALSAFLEQLRISFPWRLPPLQQQTEGEGGDDWFVSLQMEGASAVLAAVDLMTQLRHINVTTLTSTATTRDTSSSPTPSSSEAAAALVGTVVDLSKWKIAVGSTSYHGPPSTSPGSNTPLHTAKHNQILYPVPPLHHTHRISLTALKEEEGIYIAEFIAWLDAHADDVSCMLVEPQWGSSAAATPWNPVTLRRVIELAHSRGILVVADEIMCGLGRHGLGTLFVSEAWGLDVDAVTFGKAIASGAFPLSGVIVRHGARQLGSSGCSVLQSHTYSGGHTRALLAATEVLRLIPSFHSTISTTSTVLETVMRLFEERSDELFHVQGMGLMWGALVNTAHPLLNSCNKSACSITVRVVMSIFKASCDDNNILPYFVPIGGFMVTPLFDIDPAVITMIGHRLCDALDATLGHLAALTSDGI